MCVRRKVNVIDSFSGCSLYTEACFIPQIFCLDEFMSPNLQRERMCGSHFTEREKKRENKALEEQRLLLSSKMPK